MISLLVSSTTIPHAIPAVGIFAVTFSAVGARGEITDSGDLYHYIVFPSYHDDNFSIRSHVHP